MFTFNSRLQLVSDHDGLKIISHIVHLCSNKSQLEWGLVHIFPTLFPGPLIFLPSGTRDEHEKKRNPGSKVDNLQVETWKCNIAMNREYWTGVKF